jgi:hypothetical protein
MYPNYSEFYTCCQGITVVAIRYDIKTTKARVHLLFFYSLSNCPMHGYGSFKK